MSISTRLCHRLWIPITAVALLLSTALVWAGADALLESDEAEAVADDDDGTTSDGTSEDTSDNTSGETTGTSSAAWTGNAVETVVNHYLANQASGEEVSDYADSATVYLYNIATGLFVNQGGYWGTQPRLLSIGIPMSIGTTVEYNESTHTVDGITYDTRTRLDSVPFTGNNYKFYYINTGVNNNNTTGYLGYVTEDYAKGSDASADERSYDRFYLDRNPCDAEYTGDCSVNFVLNEQYSDTVYQIRIASEDNDNNTFFYLTATADTDHGGYTVEPTTEANGDYSNWILVTLADLVAAFNETEASDASPADATFMLKDQHFHRNNDDYAEWEFSSETNTDYGSTLEVKGRPDLYTYHVYNGIGYNYDNDDMQIDYGQYWIGNFYDVTEGSLSQSVDIVKRGWYRVSMKGFYLPSDTRQHKDKSDKFVLILGADGSGTWSMKNYIKLEETETEDVYYAEDVEFNACNASIYYFAVYDAEEDWSLNDGLGNLDHRYGGTTTNGRSGEVTLGEKCTMYKNYYTSSSSYLQSHFNSQITGTYNVKVSLVEDDYYILVEGDLEEIYLVDGTAEEWSDETVTTLTQTASGATTYTGTITVTDDGYTFAVYTTEDTSLGLTYRYAADSSTATDGTETITIGEETTLYSNADYSTATSYTIADAGTYTVTVTATTDDEGNVSYTILVEEVIVLPETLLICADTYGWDLSTPSATLTKTSASTDETTGVTTYTYTTDTFPIKNGAYFAVFSSDASSVNDGENRYGGYISGQSITPGTTSNLYNNSSKETSFQLSATTDSTTYTVTVTLTDDTDASAAGTILLEENEKGSIYLWGSGGNNWTTPEVLTEAVAGSGIYYSSETVNFTLSDWLCVSTFNFNDEGTWAPRYVVSSTYTPEETATLTYTDNSSTSFQVSTAGDYYVVVDMSTEDNYTFLLTATDPLSSGEDSSDEETTTDYTSTLTTALSDIDNWTLSSGWSGSITSSDSYYTAGSSYLSCWVSSLSTTGSLASVTLTDLAEGTYTLVLYAYADFASSTAGDTYLYATGTNTVTADLNTSSSSYTDTENNTYTLSDIVVGSDGQMTIGFYNASTKSGSSKGYWFMLDVSTASAYNSLTLTSSGTSTDSSTDSSTKYRADATDEDATEEEEETTTTSAMTAYLSVVSGVKGTNSSSTVTLFEEGSTNFTVEDIDTPEGYLKAGQYLTDANTSSAYTTSTYVYVTVDSTTTETTDDEGNTTSTTTITPTSLTISINVENGTYGWVAFDDVELAYLGDASQYIVLDETETGISVLNNQLANAIAYGKSKVTSTDTDTDTDSEDTDTDSADSEETTTEETTSSDAYLDNMINYTLVLARPLTDGVWNSIVLPVDLTGSQVQTAFGGSTRLAKFTSVTKNSSTHQTLNFTTVNLSSDSLHYGTLYLIKPSSSALTTPSDDNGNGSFTTPLPSDGTDPDSYKSTVTSNYYLIPQVSFPKDVCAGDAKYEEEITGTTITGSYETLTMKGTYTKQTNKVPSGSYVVGKTSDGTWGFYHYTGTSNLTIKGFRTWIEGTPTSGGDDENSNDEGGETSSVRLSFTIDGAYDESLGGDTSDDEDEATAISAVESNDDISAVGNASTDNRVYSLSGQLLRSNASVDGLARGVYIVNGKKYIVK